MNNAPVRAVILYKIAVTLVTSLASRSNRRSWPRIPIHSQITTKMGAPKMNAANKMCNWAAIQTQVRLPYGRATG